MCVCLRRGLLNVLHSCVVHKTAVKHQSTDGEHPGCCETVGGLQVYLACTTSAPRCHPSFFDNRNSCCATTARQTSTRKVAHDAPRPVNQLQSPAVITC